MAVDHIDLEIGSPVWFADTEEDVVQLLEIREINIKLTKDGEKIEYVCDDPRTDRKICFIQGMYKVSNIFFSQQQAQDFLDNQDDEHGKLFTLYSTDGYREYDMETVVVPYRYIRNSSSGILSDKGAEWFRKKYYKGFDNGKYYRLREITEEQIKKLIDKIEAYTEIVDLWNQNN